MYFFSELPAPAHYFPFEKGRYSTAPGLHKLGHDFGNAEVDRKIFQLDTEWHAYRSNKEACREENLEKYVCAQKEKPESLKTVCDFIVARLLKEYPAFFTLTREDGVNIFYNRISGERLRFGDDGHLSTPRQYRNLLDALAMQLQEDLAIWQMGGDHDWMSNIHLCAPNHWDPAAKVGKSFSEVHLPVAGMESMRARYQPMLRSFLRGGTYVRFAWGLSTDKRLNHHPEAPADHDPLDWEGRAFDPAKPKLYVRTERQTLTGFPHIQAVLFSIRTYFESVSGLNMEQKKHLKVALDSMSEESIHYKGLHRSLTGILNFLS